MDIKWITFYLVASLPFLVQGQSVQDNPFEIKRRLVDLTAKDSIANDSAGIDQVVSDTIQTFDTSVPTEIDSSSQKIPVTVTGPDTIFDSPFITDTLDQKIDYDSIETGMLQDGSTQKSETEEDSSSAILKGIQDVGNNLGRIEVLSNQNLLIGTTIIILLLLASLLALNRSLVKKCYRAISNDNYLRFLFREFKSMPWLYWMFYLYFFL